MKIIKKVIIITMALISMRAFSQINTYEIGAKTFMKTVFQQRCFAYSKGRSRFNCYELVSKKNGLIDIFDMNLNKNRNGIKLEYVYFKDELVDLVNKVETKNYLEELFFTLGDVENDQDLKFNLWDFTLDYLDGNKLLAAKYLAVLFQDASMKHQMLYLQRLKLIKDPDTESILNSLVEYFSRDGLKNNPLYKTRISIFPESLEVSNSLSHHFYIPMYLNLKLKENYPDFGKQINALTTYISIFYKTSQYYQGKKILYKEYNDFDLADSKDQYRLKDMYACYSASYFSDETKLNYQEFSTQISDSTSNFLRKLFRK